MDFLRIDGKRNPNRRKAVEDGKNLELTSNQYTTYDTNFKRFRKTALTFATQIPVRFFVDTIEGEHEGQPGDYLAIGPAGEMYPIAKDIFLTTYELDE